MHNTSQPVAMQAHEAPTAEKISPDLIGAIIATAILSFLGLFLETVLNVLFPALMNDFGVGMSDVQWMTSGYLLVVSVVMPITGWLQRRFTQRSLFFTAAATIFAGALIAALAPSYPILLAGRLLQGVGTGIITPLMFTIILTRSPRSKLGQLMGIGALSLGVAPALGPFIGGIVGEVSSWRAIFWAALVLVSVSFACGWASIKGDKTESVALDWRQVGLIAITFVGLILGIERLGATLSGSGRASDLAVSLILIVVGVAAAVAFVAVNTRSTSPVIRLSVLAHPTYRYGLLAFSFFQFAALGLGYLLPNAAQLALGMGSLQAGLLVLPGAVLGGLMAPVSGSLLDRFGPRTPILAGSGVALVATVMLAIRGTALDGMWMAAFYFLFMFGFGLAYTNTQTHAMAHAQRELTADGTALMNTIQQFFGAVSMTILATVVALSQAGTTAGSDAYMGATSTGVFYGFVIVAVIVAVALAFEWASMRSSKMVALSRSIDEGDQGAGSFDEVEARIDVA
ncbi:MFS transporter [Schaalia vaccimaxillae]|uniref:MFS transporter n=1 Tax=Schaalia vaccimaxillae TaxID=183916 RepID=UPI0003B72092|nr:MFS transporter [Schaalia vaccimaxillae]